MDDQQSQHESRPNRHDAVHNLFLRLGYDITENMDVQRLAANLRYSEEHRRQDERTDSNKLAWFVTAFIAVLGSGATVVGQILFNKIFGIMPGK